MGLMNLKFSTNYNNIKISSGGSAVLYISETWHMQLQRKNNMKLLWWYIKCDTYTVIEAKQAGLIKLELWFMCYLREIWNQMHVFHKTNPIWGTTGEQAAADLQIYQTYFPISLSRRK